MRAFFIATAAVWCAAGIEVWKDGKRCVLDEDTTNVCIEVDATGPREFGRGSDGALLGGRAAATAAAQAPCCVGVKEQKHPSLNTCGGSRPTGLPFAGRSPVHARNGMAATSVPLSTICALDILKAGGSAVDAAIAANACENVVEPMMNGMGGDLMAQVWDGATGTLHGYNGAGRSPMGLSYAELEAELKSLGTKYIPGAGPLGVSVPGAVMGWCDLHEKFGKLPFADLFKSAIDYARNGHPVAQVIAYEWYIPANN
eukprot:gene2580-4000_t